VIQDDEVAGSVDVRKPIGIEIGFSVLRLGEPVLPKIKVYDRDGDVAFNALDTSPRWQEPTGPGDYVTTAWIPGNLLNEGFTSVDVSIVSLAAPKLHPHAGSHDAVSFHVHDPGEGDSARGPFTGQVRGVVRPLLEWSSEER
jgi:lipopolysaccharide transport system ATP-binding protein